MSTTKRDNWEFRQALAAGHAHSVGATNQITSKTGQTAHPLRLQSSWDEGTTHSGDPYNRVGTRARRATI